MSGFRCLARILWSSGRVRYWLGERLAGRYLEFVAGRCRPDTLRAVAFGLESFFSVAGKDPVEVTAADVFGFLADRRGERAVIRLAGRESGLSARTIARRLPSVSGLYAYLVARGGTPVQVNPVPRGLVTRRQGGSVRSRTAPLVRVPRTLPRVLSPAEAGRLVAALRTGRDRAVVLGMLLAGLRRCEVLGLRFADVQVADRRLVIVEGKGGHHRVVPAANRFFGALGCYLHDERPCDACTDRVFVVLEGPRRGRPLPAGGLDEIMAGARKRAGLQHATCHELRHTCLTRLQGRGVAPDATFGEKREDARPALQLPRRSRRAGRVRRQCGGDLRCQDLVASAERMLNPLPLHPVTRMVRQMQRKAQRRGRMPLPSARRAGYSAGLVIRSLPVGRPAWRWRRCRPRRGTGPSSPPGSACTWPTTGWPRSTCGPRS
jgi:integrase/recombinase XerD